MDNGCGQDVWLVGCWLLVSASHKERGTWGGTTQKEYELSVFALILCTCVTV